MRYKRWEIWIPCPPVPLPVTVTVYEKPSDTLRLVHGMSHCINLYLIFFLLAANDTIDHLDLSWNHLRNKGACAVALSLKVCSNVFFYDCNLADLINRNNAWKENINKLNNRLFYHFIFF